METLKTVIDITLYRQLWFRVQSEVIPALADILNRWRDENLDVAKQRRDLSLLVS